MSRVTITLEDNNAGTVNQTISYEMAGKGVFDDNSQAHQYSRVILGLAAEFARDGVASITQDGKEDSGIILIN